MSDLSPATVARYAVAVLTETVVLGSLFYLLSRVASPHRGRRPWWRKSDIGRDLAFWFAYPLVGQVTTYGLMFLAFAAWVKVFGESSGLRFVAGDLGPVRQWPLAAQVFAYAFGLDAMMFATHWVFHRTRLWRFHAEHHKTTQVEWISSNRFHPLDQLLHAVIPGILLVVAGVPHEIFIVAAPFQAFHAVLIHADLDWDFGPLRYVLASPVFHRWHHTPSHQGGMKNFASTFPVLDLVAGTFYMPRGERPTVFGLDDDLAPAPAPAPAPAHAPGAGSAEPLAAA